MPTYDYECQSCGHRFDVFQSMTAKVLRKCPACGKQSLQRLIGPGAGFIFKGDGFYTTDYRSTSYQAGKKAAEGSGGGDKPDATPKEGGSNDKGSTDKSSKDKGSKDKKTSTAKSSSDRAKTA